METTTKPNIADLEGEVKDCLDKWALGFKGHYGQEDW